MVAFDPAAHRWRFGRRVPCKIDYGGYWQSAWLGDRYAVSCGTTSVAIYTPRTDAWRVVHTGRSAFTTRSGSAVAWTGRELVAWSGTPSLSGNPTPPDGASLTVPR